MIKHVESINILITHIFLYNLFTVAWIFDIRGYFQSIFLNEYRSQF